MEQSLFAKNCGIEVFRKKAKTVGYWSCKEGTQILKIKLKNILPVCDYRLICMFSITTWTCYKFCDCNTHIHMHVYVCIPCTHIRYLWPSWHLHFLDQLFTPRQNFKSYSPQYTVHSMPSSIMEGSIVLVRFSIRSIWVKSFFQLGVAFVDLAGQVFISIHKSFAELGGCISHVAGAFIHLYSSVTCFTA